jgi:transcriptional regulator with XRE-family HTH domain
MRNVTPWKADASTRRALVVKLRVMRYRVGLSQCQLAARIGMLCKTYSAKETAHRIHRLTVLELGVIAKACGLTMAEFFSIEPSREERFVLDLVERDDAT